MAVPITPGALALQTLKVRDPSLKDLAVSQRLGTTQQNVSNWRRGRSRPNAYWRRVIQAHLGIPEDDWMTADERARLGVVGRPRNA